MNTPTTPNPLSAESASWSQALSESKVPIALAVAESNPVVVIPAGELPP